MSDVYMMAPTSALCQPKRFAKMVPAFLTAGADVHFIGWERQHGEMDKLRWADTRVFESSILRGGGYVSKTARAMYPLWMLLVFLAVLRIGRKRFILCLGWETAFPAVIASLFTGSKIVFDDGDRFSMVIKLPGILHKVIVVLERWTSRQSFLHLVPGWSRYEWHHPNMMLVQNTPSRADLSAAEEAAAHRSAKGQSDDLVVYANGWLGETRGAGVILNAVELLRNRSAKVKLVIAGRVDSDHGRQLLEHPLVENLGELPSADALSYYFSSDVVITYYDPKIAINRHAESNKWGDCIYSMTPFIVNREVYTAECFVNEGIAWNLPYASSSMLADFLEKLSRDRSLVQEAARKTVNFLDQRPLFEDQCKKIVGLFRDHSK